MKSSEDQKKKNVFTAIWDYIRPEFVGFICAGWLLIVSSSSAQMSMGGRINLDGGTLTLDGGTRPPASPLQFKYCPYVGLRLQAAKLFFVKLGNYIHCVVACDSMQSS